MSAAKETISSQIHKLIAEGKLIAQDLSRIQETVTQNQILISKNLKSIQAQTSHKNMHERILMTLLLEDQITSDVGRKQTLASSIEHTDLEIDKCIAEIKRLEASNKKINIELAPLQKKLAEKELEKRNFAAQLDKLNAELAMLHPAPIIINSTMNAKPTGFGTPAAAAASNLATAPKMSHKQ